MTTWTAEADVKLRAYMDRPDYVIPKGLGTEEAEFDAWIAEQFDARWQLGRERYHADNKVFRGDPLQHLTEELFDALVYLWVLRRKLSTWTADSATMTGSSTFASSATGQQEQQ